MGKFKTLVLSVLLLCLFSETFAEESNHKFSFESINGNYDDFRLLGPFGSAILFGRNWPQFKENLQTLIDKKPKSQYLPDAMLMLAGGLLKYENDKKTAINLYKHLIKKYYDEPTVIRIGQQCYANDCVDHVLKFYISDFRPGNQRKERVKILNTYYNHLSKYPNKVGELAEFRLTLLKDPSITIDTTKKYLKRLKNLIYYDRLFFVENMPYSVSNNFYRLFPHDFPEIGKFDTLNNNDKKALIEEYQELISLFSPDGMQYELNELLADIYMKFEGEKSNKGIAQYKIALYGLHNTYQRFKNGDPALIVNREFWFERFKFKEKELIEKLDKTGCNDIEFRIELYEYMCSALEEVKKNKGKSFQRTPRKRQQSR